MFMKGSVFQKYYLIYLYFIAETVFDTNDIIRGYTEEVILFLAMTG